MNRYLLLALLSWCSLLPADPMMAILGSYQEGNVGEWYSLTPADVDKNVKWATATPPAFAAKEPTVAPPSRKVFKDFGSVWIGSSSCNLEAAYVTLDAAGKSRMELVELKGVRFLGLAMNTPGFSINQEKAADVYRINFKLKHIDPASNEQCRYGLFYSPGYLSLKPTK